MWSARSQSRLEGWTALHCNHSLANNEVWVTREIIHSASLTLSLVYKSWTWEDWNSVFLRGLVIGIIKLTYARTDHPRKTLLLHSDTIYGLGCYESYDIFHYLYSAASHFRWWTWQPRREQTFSGLAQSSLEWIQCDNNFIFLRSLWNFIRRLWKSNLHWSFFNILRDLCLFLKACRQGIRSLGDRYFIFMYILICITFISIKIVKNSWFFFLFILIVFHWITSNNNWSIDMNLNVLFLWICWIKCVTWWFSFKICMWFCYLLISCSCSACEFRILSLNGP